MYTFTCPLRVLALAGGRSGCLGVAGEPIKRRKGEGSISYDESSFARILGPGRHNFSTIPYRNRESNRLYAYDKGVFCYKVALFYCFDAVWYSPLQLYGEDTPIFASTTHSLCLVNVAYPYTINQAIVSY